MSGIIPWGWCLSDNENDSSEQLACLLSFMPPALFLAAAILVVVT